MPVSQTTRTQSGDRLYIALTRGVSPAIDRCELTHIGREAIDLPRAVAQHEDYCDRLEALGQ